MSTLAKIALMATVGLSGSAGAHGPVQHYYPQQRHQESNYNWVLPAIIGGAVTYAVTRSYEQPVPYVQLPQPRYCPTTVVNPYTGRYENVYVICQ